MKKQKYLSICLVFFIAAIVLFLFSENSASAENSFSFSDNGLQEILFIPVGGKIKVNLPDDIRPGDTISGTVYAEPAGKTEAERAANSAELSGYVVEIAGAKQTDWKKVGNDLSAIIKFALTEGKTVSVLLKSKTGAVVSNVPMAVQSLSMTMPPTSPPTANDFKLPTMGQQGRSVEIQGPFDGNFDNTSVTINGQPVQVLSESPRTLALSCPTNTTGVSEIAVKEGNVETKGQFRNLGVNLRSPKTNLKKGEKTTITVRISGLEGITQPVPLQLVTTGSVNMSGGNTQNIQIAPSQVGTGGTFTQNFALTGTQAGAFNVTATVTGPRTDGQDDCVCKCEANKPAITQALKRGIKGGGTAYTYAPSFTTSCTGSQCTSKVTYVWSIGAGSTATYTVRAGTEKEDRFIVDVTGSGTLEISVTATNTCSPGGTCTATGSKTFDVKK